ncbi:uncharacterized protein METZ01_LOCUS159766, partial [marine metagenome]
MKKIIVTLMITGSLYAQDDIILKSAGTDATKGILFQNSNADTLMDIDGDGLISIFGTSNKGAKLRLYGTNATYLELASSGNYTSSLTWNISAGGQETDNMFIGQGTGESITTGGGNMGLGYFALNKLTSGGYNVGIGRYALEKNTTGSNNV